MDFQTLKQINIGKILVGVAILIVIISAISFQEQIPYVVSPKSPIYDKGLIGALNVIKVLVPKNDTIVVSSRAPLVAYFTGHLTHTPYGVSSEKTLVNYMISKELTYLVVFENLSDEEGLKTLFSSKGLAGLNNDFSQVATYKTDYDKIHLYQRKA